MKPAITTQNALPLWHFVAVSPHIEVEERVFTEQRLMILTKMVRWAHAKYINKNQLRGWDRIPNTGRFAHMRYNNWYPRGARLKDPILTVTITPINRVES